MLGLSHEALAYSCMGDSEKTCYTIISGSSSYDISSRLQSNTNNMHMVLDLNENINNKPCASNRNTCATNQEENNKSF